MSTYKLSCFFLLNASLLKEYKKLKYLLTYIKRKDYLSEAFFFLMFQAYSIIFQHLYTLKSDQHHKSSCHLSP